ncbi:MAG: 23S rRNA (pseudouridine(1915)-N(3))-methyltransferase RlmH [Bacilli bacterium]|nr:23S rRNA (pseudouridine(1915)-N(3))-methyltransferase RlmH [Bacilli bacterium]
MMIKIIVIGKLKEKYLIEAVNDYKKRINKYHKLEIVEIKDTNIYNEEKEIISLINKNEYILLLDIFGKEYSSVEFSNKLQNLFNSSNSNITFIIGSSEGVTEKIKEIVNEKISFSKFTFPHGLFRVILLEQLYRSFKIINNEKYHK